MVAAWGWKYECVCSCALLHATMGQEKEGLGSGNQTEYAYLIG